MGKFKTLNIAPSLEALNKLAKVADSLIGANNINTVFEFGSRYGEDTIAFAQRYPKGTVYSFECNPNTVTLLKETISNYTNIVFTNKAVSDKNGTLSFFKIDKEKTQTTWLDGNQGASSIFKASGKYPLEDYFQEEVEVDTVTLSTFLTENNLDHIDILWMDIQGAELMALKGLGDRIKDVKIIHTEVEFFEIYQDQPLYHEIDNFLSTNGFELAGFTTHSHYAGDAVFINKSLFSKEQIKKSKRFLAFKLLTKKLKIRVMDIISRSISFPFRITARVINKIKRMYNGNNQ